VFPPGRGENQEKQEAGKGENHKFGGSVQI